MFLMAGRHRAHIAISRFCHQPWPLVSWPQALAVWLPLVIAHPVAKSASLLTYLKTSLGTCSCRQRISIQTTFSTSDRFQRNRCHRPLEWPTGGLTNCASTCLSGLLGHHTAPLPPLTSPLKTVSWRKMASYVSRVSFPVDQSILPWSFISATWWRTHAAMWRAPFLCVLDHHLFWQCNPPWPLPAVSIPSPFLSEVCICLRNSISGDTRMKSRMF